MKIIAFSDGHGRLPTNIPECDVLIIAGDFCAEFCQPFDPDIMRMRQMEWLQAVYAPWEQAVPAKHILITPGNHDWIIRLPEGLRSRMFIDEGCEILDETTDTLRTFWFSPWVAPVCAWNYMLSREQRKRCFSAMPYNLDVLVCHSPAERILDQSFDGDYCGCPELRALIRERKPKHFCFGHIHEGFRVTGIPHLAWEQTMVHNCAMAGRNWTPVEFNIW